MKKLFSRTVTALMLVIMAAAYSFAQDSFAYQAVIRDAKGELIISKEVNLRFSLMNGESTYYVETQKAKTNEYGNISVEIGKGTATQGAMADVPWSTFDIKMKVEVDAAGGNKFVTLGETKFLPAPYAMYAATSGEAAVNGATKAGENLFEVADRDGNIVFAVTPNGIVVYVDDTPDSKAARSGFIVTGRTATKDGKTNDYFAVTADGTQVFIDDSNDGKSAAARSGFIITGRTATKNKSVDSQEKSDRTADTDLFAIDGSLTTVYVDDNNDDKSAAARSGFVVTGRTATKDGNIVDVNAGRTSLVTDNLSIANSASVGEVDEPVAALQISGANITMSNDLSLEGGVRPALDTEKIEKSEEYNVWLSDSRTDDAPDGYDITDTWGYFEFYNESSYSWLGAFHDDLVVPLSSEDAMLMFNRDGEETAIAEDAVAVVSYRWGDINVWPLEALDNFTLSFALTDYYPTSSYGGNADEYARYNVTLNSTKPYAGCNVNLDGEIPYTAKITTSDNTFEEYVVRNSNGYSSVYFSAVYGRKVTVEAIAPPDKLFSHWLVNGRRYNGNPANLPVLSSYTKISAVFKDESVKLYVDGTETPVEDPDRDGSKEHPYKTIAEALDSVSRNIDSEVGYRIMATNVKDSVDIKAGCNNHASYITFDINKQNSQIYQIIDATTVPVYVRNLELKPKNFTGGDVVQVKAEGAKLSLEGCAIDGQGNDTPNQMHGVNVSAGELVLAGSRIEHFVEKSAALVAGANATLTLKGQSYICNNGGTNKIGCGVYLGAGATLNAEYCGLYSNAGYDWYYGEPGDYGHTEGYAGSSVFVEAGANLNVYVNAYIGGVGLAEGAKVTAVGDFSVEMEEEPGHEPREIDPVVIFDTIVDPTQVVVLLGNGTDTDKKDEIYSRFVIDNKSLIENGYLREIGLDGKPVKSNVVYSKGTINMSFAEAYVDVNYTYYHGENDEEFLHLKYNFENANYEYQNFWLVGETIYYDTIYANSTVNHPNYPGYLPLDVFANAAGGLELFFSSINFDGIYPRSFTAERGDTKNVLVIDPAVLEQYEAIASETEAGVWAYNDIENHKPVLYTKNGIVTYIQAPTDYGDPNPNPNVPTFTNGMPAVVNLLYQSMAIKGRGLSFEDLKGISWNAQTTIFGECVTGVDYADDNACTYTLDKINERFGKLRDGFNVAVSSLGGKVIAKIDDGPEQTIVGFDTLKVKFDQTITLIADADSDTDFEGWSNGDELDECSITVRNDEDVYPIFRYIDGSGSKAYYVSGSASANGNGTDAVLGSSGNPFNSVNMAALAIERCGATGEVTINVSGEVKGPQTLGQNIQASSIAICGTNNATDILNGNKMGSVLTINTTSTVTISNLTITNGYADNNGGGIYNNGGSITLESGALIFNNTAYYRGGGIYNYGGTIVMNSGSSITQNTTQDDYSNSADKGGGGILTIGGSVTINAGATISNNKGGYRGGGIMLFDKAQVTLNGGSINNNTAGIYGGGVMFGNASGDNPENKATFTMKSGTIKNNTAKEYNDWWHGFGGGVYVVWGDFVLKDGEISNNQARHAGGGLFVTGNASITMSGGTISSNQITDDNSGDNGGAGVFLYSTFNMSGGTISGNNCNGHGKGNGIFDSGIIEMSGTATIAGDIYMDGGRSITIGGPLSKPNVATITMFDYNYEGQVLELAKIDNDGTPINTTTLVAEYGKFALTNSGYTIGFDGYLKENITYGDKGYVKYKIKTPESYKTLFDTLNFYKINTENLYISVEADLTLDGFKPYDPGDRISFKGVFDGNGKTLTINSINKAQFMVICYRNEGIIQNVKVDKSGTVVCGGSGADHTLFSGGICHENRNGGIIRNCWSNVSANVTFTEPIGGICTHNYQGGVIENCLNTGNITGTFAAGSQADEYGVVGGICGSNYGEIKNCVNHGTISMPTSYNSSSGLNGIPGAICGAQYSEGSCNNCYWLKDCVINGNNTNNSNNMIYNDNRVRKGTVTHCGYFEEAQVERDGMPTNIGTIEAGEESQCGSSQELQYGTDLVDALNGYVGLGNTILKRWMEGDNQAAVLRLRY